MKKLILASLTLGIALAACKKEDPEPETTSANVIFKFKFDPTQERLDNLGNPASIPSGHGAQSPDFNSISAHYVEMTKNIYTAVGDGEIVYQGPETTAGGDKAVDFDQAKVVGDNETFLTIPISDIAAGSYSYLRVSLTYQNYDIDLRANGLDFTGTLASFVGYNNYITNLTIDQQSIAVNDDKLQGFWAFETQWGVSQGQAPPGATTVPNPLFATSPIPQGSCIVSGEFDTPLTITGNETEDITVTISLSTNNSFEWKDALDNGIYEPLDGDTVVDMGLRGLIPIVD